MFGGPPVESEPAVKKDPVGDYKLTHDMALAAERLFAEPGRNIELDTPCPACGHVLIGRGNSRTRTITISCSNCTYRINR
ncbi:MAG: hypothetical protein M3281_04540 [Chloroflexota bacterium]|nr:hypothetical protein [Chloroflexota bacterium]